MHYIFQMVSAIKFESSTITGTPILYMHNFFHIPHSYK